MVCAGHNNRDEIKIYGLDRPEEVEITDGTYKLPKDFNADDYFSTAYGAVIGYDVKPERIVIRANEDHKHCGVLKNIDGSEGLRL